MFPNNTDNQNESVEIISNDNIFVVPFGEIKKETADQEFQAGMSVLEEMDESIFSKKLKNEPLDIKPKIEPKEEVTEKDSLGQFEKSTENVNTEETSDANPEIKENVDAINIRNTDNDIEMKFRSRAL